MKKTVFVILVLGLIVVMLQLFNNITQSQATVEAARAMQISAAGQSIASLGLVIALVVLVILLAVMGIILIITRMQLQRMSQPQAQHLQGKWISGPNANWGRKQLPAPNTEAEFLMAMSMYEYLKDQQQGQLSLPSYSARADDDIEEVFR